LPTFFQFLNSVFGILGSSFLAQTAFLLFVVYVIKEVSMGICSCKKRLDGKVAFVTGANSGAA
jgi:hypothetical protein